MTTPPSQSESLRRREARRAWALSVAVAALSAVTAVAQLGRLHPDEVYQLLEPAWGRATGYAIWAWEWQVGLRNWALPLVASWLLRACLALGITHPRAYRAVLELPQWALHAWALVGCYRYARRRVGPAWATWAVPLVGLFGPVLTFSGRTLGESLSTSFLLVALERLDRPQALRKAAALGGALLGLAVVARYGSAVVVAAAMLWLLLARRHRTFAFAAAGGAAVALALGALDAWTWGQPFHSLRAYLDFNVLSGKAAAQFGAEPATFYLPLLLWLPWWALPGLAWAVLRQSPRLGLPAFCALAYLGAISLTAHKEARFLYPTLALVALAAAPGVLGLLARQSRPDLAQALAVLAVGLSLAPWALTSPYDVQRPDQFRALIAASRGDATGLLVVNEGVWGAGGYFYLGRQLPWMVCDWPRDGAFQAAMRDRRVNRVVTYEDRALPELVAAGFRVVMRDGRAAVLAR